MARAGLRWRPATLRLMRIETSKAIPRGAALRAPGSRGLICWPLWELLPIETVCGITLKAIVLSCYYRVSLPWGFAC